MKPTIYFQGSNAGSLPTKQEELRWNEETELGTLMTGDGNSTGIFLGALTNASYSDDFDVIITHNAQEPVTGVKFYFQKTTNVRTGGTGFTSTDDVIGAEADYNELLDWGDASFNGDQGTSANDGIYLTFKDESEDQDNCQLRRGYMDELSTSKPLTLDGKPGGSGTPDVINTFNGYEGGDYAWLKLRLFVPESLEEAGKRQLAMYTRLTYTF